MNQFKYVQENYNCFLKVYKEGANECVPFYVVMKKENKEWFNAR